MIVCSALLVAIITVAVLWLPFVSLREAMRERELEDRLEF